MKAAYASMPDNDRDLEQWLKDQRGVVAHTVHVTRKGSTIRIIFIMQRNGHGNPPFPDLSSACHSLGYTEVLAEWSDDR
jgi:hypothetical protein